MKQAPAEPFSCAVIGIGASTGGVEALRILCGSLAADLPAAVLIVLHIDAHPSVLPSILDRAGAFRAAHAIDGELLLPGRIYVAPPDQHMMVSAERVHLQHGPKEHHTRPAVDPLFRSLAEHHGPRSIGVVLTGSLNDGTLGLERIRAAGGRTLAQDPAEAADPSMPRHAMVWGAASASTPLADMPQLLAAWAREVEGRSAGPQTEAPRHAQVDPTRQDRTVFVCPSCKGSLERSGEGPYGFRCYVGHRFTLDSLAHAQDIQTDEALWSAYRALCEKAFLLAALAEEARTLGREDDAKRYEAQAGQTERLAAIALGVARRSVGTLAQVPPG